MADLLGSILGSMEKPPSLGQAEKNKIKEQKVLLEKRQEAERLKLQKFRETIQKKIHTFIQDGTQANFRFDAMDKVYRAIIHEVADIASLTSFSFGLEEEDRYVMIWKKEFAPGDDELSAYKRGEEWDPEKAKKLAEQKEIDAKLAQVSTRHTDDAVPSYDYKNKYEHLIGRSAAKDAAVGTATTRSYGLVNSENKRDQRTIEQVLADNKARKKQKTEHGEKESAGEPKPLSDCVSVEDTASQPGTNNGTTS